jgi:hypothetical protein
MLISPGQIVQLQISGLQYLSTTGSFEQNASGTPLPATLAGLSARIGQNLPPFSGLSFFALPLIAVKQFATCSPLLAECSLTLLTVQIPFELVATPQCTNCATHAVTPIIITQNGKDSAQFSFAFLVPDTIHVVSGCDFHSISFCRSAAATHGDGSEISADFPAVPGETIVVLVFDYCKTRGDQNSNASDAVSADNTAGATHGGVSSPETNELENVLWSYPPPVSQV